MTFDADWFRSALAFAASRAGYQSWWLVDDLVAGVSHHLRYTHAGGVIDLTRLEAMVRSMLLSVGYEEIASQFQTVSPFRSISLLQCLCETTRNDHRKFFDHLAEQIKLVHRTRVRRVHFSELHACTRELQNTWQPVAEAEHRSLLRGIVVFIREHIQTGWRTQEVLCSIS